LGFPAGEAEAEEKAANLESRLKKTDEALKDYALAADLYRKLGNEAFLNRVQISESVTCCEPMVEQVKPDSDIWTRLRKASFPSFL